MTACPGSREIPRAALERATKASAAQQTTSMHAPVVFEFMRPSRTHNEAHLEGPPFANSRAVLRGEKNFSITHRGRLNDRSQWDADNLYCDFSLRLLRNRHRAIPVSANLSLVCADEFNLTHVGILRLCDKVTNTTLDAMFLVLGDEITRSSFPRNFYGFYDPGFTRFLFFSCRVFVYRRGVCCGVWG